MGTEEDSAQMRGRFLLIKCTYLLIRYSPASVLIIRPLCTVTLCSSGQTSEGHFLLIPELKR